jgi:hypothetical protein
MGRPDCFHVEQGKFGSSVKIDKNKQARIAPATAT